MKMDIRYADLRRRLLIDPHAVEDPHKPHQSKVDNPLSQDPGKLMHVKSFNQR